MAPELLRREISIPTSGEIHDAAFHFLIEGDEFAEAKLLLECRVEIGELRQVVNLVNMMNITLRCDRRVFEQLKPVPVREYALPSESPMMQRIRAAIEASLPSGYGIANLDARVSGTRVKTSDKLAAELAAKMETRTKPGDEAKMRELAFAEFAEPDYLKALGRESIKKFFSFFKADNGEPGLILPDDTLPDDRYVEELSQMLTSLELSPTGLRVRIGEVLRLAKIGIAEANQELENRYAKVPLDRRTSGKRLLGSVAGGHGMYQDYPEDLTAEQSEVVGLVLEYLRDYADICDDMEPSDFVKFAQEVSNQMDRLNAMGLAVFTGRCRAKHALPEGGKPYLMPLRVVLVASTNDPRIKKRTDGTEFIIGAFPKKKAADEADSRDDAEKRPEADDSVGAVRDEVASILSELKSARREMKEIVPEERGPSQAISSPHFFRRAGSHWDVVFEGGEPFHLPDSLGAKYLDFLLHRPNQPISARELEIAISPEKATARSKTSIQTGADGQAIRDYMRRLDIARGEREQASDDGDFGKVSALDEEITGIEEALRNNPLSADDGEKSRGNVRKAIVAIVKRLRRGNTFEQAFGEHIGENVNTGYQVIYKHPQGRIWK